MHFLILLQFALLSQTTHKPFAHNVVKVESFSFSTRDHLIYRCRLFRCL